jgi:small subunit ribosomal protein S27e
MGGRAPGCCLAGRSGSPGPPLGLCADPTSARPAPQVLACDIDLLHPPAELEKRKHKLHRLVASPNSYFMDVKCQGCFTMWVTPPRAARCPITRPPRASARLLRPSLTPSSLPTPRLCSTTVFSHSQTVVVCPSCNAVLCVPSGGKARLSEGCSFRRKGD